MKKFLLSVAIFALLMTSLLSVSAQTTGTPTIAELQAIVNSLLQQIQALQAQLNALANTPPPSGSLTCPPGSVLVGQTNSIRLHPFSKASK